MGKVDENKKKKKEALFNTAYDLFTTKGINSTAISDIVETRLPENYVQKTLLQ